MSHGPIVPHLHATMNGIANVLDEALNGDVRPKTTGFLLLMFPFGDGGRMNYISNADRDDMLCALKELIANFEGRAIQKAGNA